MSGRRPNRRILIVLAVFILIVVLVTVSRFALTPSAQFTMVQHTFGNDLSLSLSGFGTLSKALVSVYLVSGDTSVRIFIVNVRVESLNYRESFPFSASVTLPNLDLPQNVWIQTFYDRGDFDFLKSHANPTVRVVIEGTWIAGSANLGAVTITSEACCIQPF